MKYPEDLYIDSQIFAADMDGSESNLTEKIVKNHYEKAYQGEFQRDDWKLEEIEFSDDGCSEIYYG